jgi:hypothetical protein
LASDERAEADPRWRELSGEDHHARSQPRTRRANPAGSTIRIGVLIALRARIAAFAITYLDQLLPFFFLRTAMLSKDATADAGKELLDGDLVPLASQV